MRGGNIFLGSSFVVFFVYIPGDMDAAISQCLLAVPKPTMQFKLLTVVGKACSEAVEKECWRIQYNTGEQKQCWHALLPPIIPPLCVAF